MLCRLYTWGSEKARSPVYVNLAEDDPTLASVRQALGEPPETKLNFHTLYGWAKVVGTFEVYVSLVAAATGENTNRAVLMCRVTCEDDWEYGQFYVDVLRLAYSDALDRAMLLWLTTHGTDKLMHFCMNTFSRDRLLAVAHDATVRMATERMAKLKDL